MNKPGAGVCISVRIIMKRSLGVDRQFAITVLSVDGNPSYLYQGNELRFSSLAGVWFREEKSFDLVAWDGDLTINYLSVLIGRFVACS